MRLWHIDLIEYLPDKQLIAQWRELNAIYKNQPKHILINYIYNTPWDALFTYSNLVIDEMLTRRFVVNTKNYVEFFKDKKLTGNMFYKEHNDEYLQICYYNLKEKYMRGQKDFTKEIWDNIENDIQGLLCEPLEGE